jgi:hypothetical protein
MGKEAIKQQEKNCRQWHLSNNSSTAKARLKFTMQEAKLADQQNNRVAEENYAQFIKWFKWGAIVSAAVTAVVVLIIAG